MLFRPADLEGIAAGTITLAFRRWDKPRVKVGLDAEDAGRACVEFTACRGGRRDHGRRRAGGGVRVAGRGRGADAQDRARLPGRAARGGAGPARGAARHAAGRRGVRGAGRMGAVDAATYLQAIARAARRCGRPTWPSRSGGRPRRSSATSGKLKELGLTESLDVGYRLSPRGEAVLRSSLVRLTASRSGFDRGGPRSGSAWHSRIGVPLSVKLRASEIRTVVARRLRVRDRPIATALRARVPATDTDDSRSSLRANG